MRKRLAAGVGTAFAAVIVYGSWRLMASPTAEHSVKVGLISKGGSGIADRFPQDDETALKLLQAYSDGVSSLSAQDAQVIVLPEKIAVVSDQATRQVDALLEATAARGRTNIVVGLDRGSRTRRFNEARMCSPEGTLAAVYDKHHMIPRFEDVDQPGTTFTVVNEPSGVWGIQICKDMDFPGLSRQYGAKRVGLLLVPAWDFVLDGWLHARMAIMRGVESGFTIVRAAKEGRLTISDDRGRILAEENGETAKFSSLFAGAPVRHDDTLYMRWGDWFAWVNVAGLVAILFGRVKKKDSSHA